MTARSDVRAIEAAGRQERQRRRAERARALAVLTRLRASRYRSRRIRSPRRRRAPRPHRGDSRTSACSGQSAARTAAPRCPGPERTRLFPSAGRSSVRPPARARSATSRYVRSPAGRCRPTGRNRTRRPPVTTPRIRARRPASRGRARRARTPVTRRRNRIEAVTTVHPRGRGRTRRATPLRPSPTMVSSASRSRRSDRAGVSSPT